jgi:mRNA interferase RelE/StbE
VRCSIQIKKSALKELRKLPPSERPRLIAAIDQLADQPYTGKLLKGDLSGLRRLRVGNYRIIYEVDDGKVLILILRVAHRKRIYR